VGGFARPTPPAEYFPEKQAGGNWETPGSGSSRKLTDFRAKRPNCRIAAIIRKQFFAKLKFFSPRFRLRGYFCRIRCHALVNGGTGQMGLGAKEAEQIAMQNGLARGWP
jgi:hypothetical protein